jgi:hypothetical protein
MKHEKQAPSLCEGHLFRPISSVQLTTEKRRMPVVAGGIIHPDREIFFLIENRRKSVDIQYMFDSLQLHYHI